MIGDPFRGCNQHRSITSALVGLADPKSMPSMARIVDTTAPDSPVVTRRQDGYVAAIDAISDTGPGPAQQFDPSTIVDTAMTRVVEHQHAEPAPDEQRVFNVQTDPLFQIAEAHHLLPEAVSDSQVDIAERIAQLTGEILSDPWSKARLAAGAVEGFVVDGAGGTLSFVFKDGPVMAWNAIEWGAGEFVSLPGWQRSLAKTFPVTAPALIGINAARRNAANIRGGTIQVTKIAASASAAAQELWALSDDDWRKILKGDTDALDANLSDQMLLAIEASHDQIAQLLIELDGDEVAYEAGRLIGMVLYELSEGALLTSLTAGAGAAAAVVKFPRIVKRLETILGAKHADKIRDATTIIFTKLARWSGSRMCFVAGTKIHAIGGLKNIEDIRPGDLVLSRPQTGARIAATELKPVVQTFVTHPDTLYHLTIQATETAVRSESRRPLPTRSSFWTVASSFLPTN